MNAIIKLSSPETREFWKIPVLHEDEHLLVLNKPDGLLISRDLLTPDRPSLTQLLHSGIAEKKGWAIERQLSYLRITHRLDAEATGIALFARTKDALIKLREIFGIERTILKY